MRSAAHRLLALLVVAFAAACAPASADEILVRYAPGTDAAERREVRAQVGATVLDALAIPRVQVLEVARGDAREAVAALDAEREVAWAEPNGTWRLAASISDDPHAGQLWGLHNEGQTIESWLGVTDADMDVPEAWALGLGSGVTVAVVDTGIDALHPDLIGQTVAGRDFVTDAPAPVDVNGHGTHVAGTIAATRNNQVGITGVAPGSKIMALKALSDSGSGSWADIAAAFAHAGAQGVKIVNASLGGSTSSLAVRDAMAQYPDTLYVVSAGNSDRDNDSSTARSYPCSYDLANILCVAASDNEDRKAAFSNYGATSVDVFGPGDDIYSTVPGGTYAYYSGTSMAAPNVAGVASLVRAANPSLTASLTRQLIIATADVKEALTGRVVGNGRANALAAISSTTGTPPAVVLTQVPATGTARHAAFAYSAAHALTVECRLDQGAWSLCGATKAYDGLAYGAHSFSVRAANYAGTATRTHTWEVLRPDPPSVTLTQVPAPRLSDTTAVLAWTTSGLVDRTECRLGAGPWSPCVSPMIFTGLARETEHALQVRAVNDGGTTEESATVYVTPLAPQVKIVTAPPATTPDPVAAIAWETQGTVEATECRLDEGAWRTCAPGEAVTVGVGPHTLAVKVVNEGGESVVTHAWTRLAGRPVLRDLKQLGNTVRSCARPTRCTPRHLGVTFVLSAPSTVRAALSRRVCTGPARKRLCSWVPVGERSFTRAAGRSTVRIGSSLDGERLPSGRYLLRLTAEGAGGTAGARSVAFRVRPPAR